MKNCKLTNCKLTVFFDNFFGFCLLDIWKSKLQIYKLTIDILEIDKFQLQIKISN